MQGKSLEELTPEEQEKNRVAATELVEGQWYEFVPPAETVPMEHRVRQLAGRKFGQSIVFSRAKYLGWREENQEHMFYARARDGKDYFAPMFMCGGVMCIPKP